MNIYSLSLAKSLTAVLLAGMAGMAGAASIDAGRATFAQNCATCHGTPARALNWSAATIRGALSSVREMRSLSSIITAAQIDDIVAYVANPTGSDTPASTTADADRLFDWAETSYPALFGGHAVSQSLYGYYLRYYPATMTYVAVKDGHVYYYNAANPAGGIVDLGLLTTWLSQAGL